MNSLEIQVFTGPGLQAGLLAFARCSALLHTMPVLGTKTVPVPVRVGLGAMLAALLAPTLAPAALAADPSLLRWDTASLCFGMLRELAVGVALGFAAQIVFSVVETVGSLAAANSGLSVAVQFDPLTQSPSLVVTRLLQAIGLLLFLGADLHHQVLLGLVDSFRLAPPGAAALFPSAGISLSQALAGIFLDAVRVSMPVVAVALFLNLAAALVTRFAHQMNVYFSLGLTANAAAGLFATALLVPALLAAVLGRADELRGAATMLVGPAALAAPAAPATPLALP